MVLYQIMLHIAMMPCQDVRTGSTGGLWMVQSIYITEEACNWVQVLYSCRQCVAPITDEVVCHAGEILHAAEALS